MSNQIDLYYLVCLQISVCTINGRALNRACVEVQGEIALRFAVNLQISCASLQLFFFPAFRGYILLVRRLSGIILLQILFLEKEENHSTMCVSVYRARASEGRKKRELNFRVEIIFVYFGHAH